ncbi:MAG: ferrous iron transport protein A [Ornithinimicrobium sp.]
MDGNRLDAAPLGTRVVVRYLIEDGERATDVLGLLTQRSDTSITVDGPSGPIVIPRSDIVAGKPIPPPPRRHTSRDPSDRQPPTSEPSA